MTSKEAINLFKQYHWKVEDKEKALEILEELVERDTPMLPIKLNWKNTKNYYFVCPKCLELVARNDEVFCLDCGQRLDWNFDFLETLKEEQKELENKNDNT